MKDNIKIVDEGKSLVTKDKAELKDNSLTENVREEIFI